ncbi:PTS system mannose/fructose/sorbose family transporter subunit IID [Enterococcus gallinarum]|uniref:PTS system mannose/fructose/sorbose family transporter subunit IID n=1 Tax=Enterococcus gallinarum TaxID=1353 RepID=UPI00288ED5E8|nr:PTS system mannose/fructose/sorbose family transporter subunit IID [Enterococcus gallinarum]MDT2730405.1 PTS system mannose/fructose/sorbose family transporter subunit IID [Enterococcus gallinarum]
MAEGIEKNTSNKLTKKELMSVYLRHYQLLGCFNYERQMSTGFGWAMTPVIKKLYSNNEEKLKEGFKRHLEFFNCATTTSPFILGISCAMEEQYANSEEGEFEVSSINSVKAALMGPLAGIGDSFFWGTFRVIGVGIGAPLAIQGNILGPLLYFLINVIPSELIRWFGFKAGYKGGSEFLTKISADGTLQKLTEATKVLGLVVIGAMIAAMVNVNVPAIINLNGAEVNIQETLDSILPKGLPLLLTFGCYGLLQKKISGTWIMFGLLLLGIIGVALGILG